MNANDRPTSKTEMTARQPQLQKSRWLMLAAALLSLSWASVAFADAKVMVQVRSASGASTEGTVLLTSTAGDNKRFRCQTTGGTCQIPAVPGGRYVVQFQPKKGDLTAPRKVMIPPSGDVKLTVAAK